MIFEPQRTQRSQRDPARHCEEGVSPTRQSRFVALDCFAALAMTLLSNVIPSEVEGSGPLSTWPDFSTSGCRPTVEMTELLEAGIGK